MTPGIRHIAGRYSSNTPAATALASRTPVTTTDIEVIVDRRRWDDIVDEHAFGHPLQLWAWGEVKRPNGWTPHRLALLREGTLVAAGQLLFWRIPAWGRSMAYLPRGPIGAPEDARAFLHAAVIYARKHGALYLRVEPGWVGVDMPASWRHVPDGILLAQTYTIDLTREEDDLLAAMRGKTRQYIRKAEKEGVVVERHTSAEHLDDMWRIYQDTAARAGFGLHPFVYYRRLFELYGERNGLYRALVDGKAEAFLWLVQGGGVAFELYGGMTARGGAHKANYALKWRAIADMKRAGCAIYDFNGRLNEGVDQFKGGFGGEEVDLIGAFDRPLRPLGYLAWRTLWPLAKPVGRALRQRGS